MGPNKGSVFSVPCPCCGAELRIDAKTQAVLTHKAPVQKGEIADLETAMAKFKGEASRREDLFARSLASHKSSAEVRDRKFEELLKQAKENPDAPPPKRDFELD